MLHVVFVVVAAALPVHAQLAVVDSCSVASRHQGRLT